MVHNKATNCVTLATSFQTKKKDKCFNRVTKRTNLFATVIVTNAHVIYLYSPRLNVEQLIYKLMRMSLIDTVHLLPVERFIKGNAHVNSLYSLHLPVERFIEAYAHVIYLYNPLLPV